MTIFGAGVTDPDDFQRRLHGGDLKFWYSSEVIVMKAMVVHRDIFLIL